MNESLDNAREEFKRVDHLIYVSLKYTRTVDIFINIFERMISCCDFVIDGFMLRLKEEKKVAEIPAQARVRAEWLKKHFAHDPEMVKYIDFYLLLRRLAKSSYTRSNEFRRHVTMTATLDGGEIMEVNIDVMMVYYQALKDFLSYTTPMLND
ncbi:MAG: hypothetical protein V1735_02000 [Nanoarchaeota archaeon]